MTLAWLLELQRDFGAAIRTPLGRETGTLRASPEGYAESLTSRLTAGPRATALERLAVYNRQYWYRLFGLLQGDYPLTAGLLGYWDFNAHAADFFLAHPPTSADIHDAARGFDRFLGEKLAAAKKSASVVPRALLCQAITIDVAFSRLFQVAACEPAWRPSAAEEPRLAAGRLRARPTWTLVTEEWALFEARHAFATRRDERPAAAPARHPRPVTYLVVHESGGVFELQLNRLQALLFDLLRRNPLANALAELEAQAAPEERRELPAAVQGWLSRSLDLGLWGGLDA